MATLTIADLDNGKRDLETVDAVANSQADTTTTRYGQQTLTLAGALRRLGWQAPVPYASGLAVTSGEMTVERDGIVYRPDPALVPFTTGAWSPDQWRVVQSPLSSEVYGFLTLSEAESAAATLPDAAQVVVQSDSAKGNARTWYVVLAGALVFSGYAEPRQTGGNIAAAAEWKEVPELVADSAAQAPAFNAQAKALAARTEYLRAIADSAANYANQKSAVSHANLFGGQLKSLAADLANPFVQFLGVCLAGDSITWGMTATGIAPITPRAGALADARNNGTSPSWANLLHRALGKRYYESSTPVEIAWPGSPSGIAQFEYSKTVDMWPGNKPVTTTGAFARLDTPESTLGVTWFVNMSSSGSGPHSFEWVMTGNTFDFVFSATTVTAKYKLYVNDVLQGEYSTNATDLGIPTSYKNVRTHTFPYAVGARVKIEAVGGDSARDTLLAEAIRINRKLRVTNNGIIGSSTREYSELIKSAMRLDDSYCIVQLGVNDRGYRDWTGPSSPSAITNNLSGIVQYIKSKNTKPVLMAVNKAETSPGVHYYSTAAVRGAVVSVGKSESVDVIDNFAVTEDMALSTFTADGLHPNDLGHKIISNNVLNSIK